MQDARAKKGFASANQCNRQARLPKPHPAQISQEVARLPSWGRYSDADRGHNNNHNVFLRTQSTTMLITLCYVYLWVRFQKCYSGVIEKTLRRRYAKNSSLSFTFSVHKSEPERRRRKTSCWDRDSHSQPPTHDPHQQCCCPPEDSMLLKLRDKAVFITEHQVCLDLSRWTLMGSAMVGGQRIDNISFVVEGALEKEVVPPPLQTCNTKVLKWSDYCIPLACSPGPPFKAVAQASVDNFSRLGVAFMEDRLRLDNGLMPSKIVCKRKSPSILVGLYYIFVSVYMHFCNWIQCYANK
ncbi:hypothetical protein N1851_010873 [Merluccius polli]|uniref:Uncharacterized protein n=1 Tax=Merluccius polli TaxID=89951 RepID=A0AA47P311_MERPO|nr:hypothetical protein N1851_010873 [Merluccius polli]